MQFMIPRLRLDNCLVHSTINQKDHNYSTALMVTPEIIVAANLYSDDPLLATRKFRRLLLRGESDSIIKVIQIGIVPKFVEFLQRDGNPALQFEAAWILMTIASGTSAQTKTIIEAESVPNLKRLLYSENDDLRDISVCALGNIAGDSPECRDYVLDQGIVNPLLQLFKKSTRISMTRNAIWALSNLCKRENPAPKFEKISPCLPVLSHLLFYTDAEVLASACWALSYISDGPEKIQAVIETGVCERLVELLMRDSPIVISAALEAVGNIVTGNEDQIQLILDCNALLYLLQLLNTTKEETRKVCWTISNIAAGGRQKIQAIIDVNIVPALLKIFSCADFRTKKEAIWTIANLIAGASPEQVSDLVNRNCIPSLCDLLTIADNEIIEVALDSLENILRQGEQIAEVTGGVNPYAVLIEKCCGLDKIENLQLHENTKIYRKAFDMIGNYFGTEKEYAAIDHKDNVGSEQFNASDDICQWIYIIPETIYQF